MLVVDVMSRGALCVREDVPLSDAIALFSRHDVGGLPVRGSGGEVVGVVSKTDVIDRLAEHASLDVRVRDAMSSPALTVREDTEVLAALEQMVNEGMHRAVVVDDAGAPVGVLTPWDVARALLARKTAL